MRQLTCWAAVAAFAVFAAVLPPFLFFSWTIAFTDGGHDVPTLGIWSMWAAVGFLFGVVGSVWFAAAQRRWLWVLLLIPSFVDGFYAYVAALAAGGA